MSDVEELNKEMLRKLAGGLITEAVDEQSSVGKDLHVMAKELTDDRNVYRFSSIRRSDIPMCAFKLAIADKEQYDPKEDGRGRYFILKRFNLYESMLRQAVNASMADRYKDLGGYLLAFRGGIEWRQAGIMGDTDMMNEQKKSVMDRLRKR